MILIGIDTGTKTGIAVTNDGNLETVFTMSIVEAMEFVKDRLGYASLLKKKVKIYIEDARKRKWVTGGREKLQGVGSVKRDAVIWEEFCVYHGIAYELVAPKNNSTKLDKETFKRLTGWQGRTSQHARDAVMLVWGRKR